MKFFLRRNKKKPRTASPSTGMNIFFRLLDGSVVPCLLKDEGLTSISTLKQQLQGKEKLPVDAIRLTYGGRCLNDDDHLNAYGIERDSTITVCLRLHGGSIGNLGFTFAGMKNREKKKLSKAVIPVYREIHRGLNLEGRCSNPGCEACTHNVWCPLGFSQEKQSKATEDSPFEIARLMYEMQCPACKHPIPADSIISCGFYKCHYTYIGYQNGTRFEGGNTVDYGNSFEFHDGGKDGKIWSSLTFSVRPLMHDD